MEETSQDGYDVQKVHKGFLMLFVLLGCISTYVVLILVIKHYIVLIKCF